MKIITTKDQNRLDETLIQSKSTSTGQSANNRQVPAHFRFKQSKPSNSTPKVKARANTNGDGGTSTQLTETEKSAQKKYLEMFRSGSDQNVNSFHMRANACFRIQEEKLYREYPTQAAFFQAKLGLRRSTGLNLAAMGRMLHRLSAAGDNKVLTSDAHCRPLMKLTDDEQDAAIQMAKELAQRVGRSEISAKLMEAVVTILHPPKAPNEQKDSAASLMAKKCQSLVAQTIAALPKDTSDRVLNVLAKLSKQVLALAGVIRHTLIDWTDRTWDVVHGCTPVSEGCRNCWAARMMATRMADLYPGLAKITRKGGHCACAFTGKIILDPDALADVLKDRVPKLVFVCSRSDLFHELVPDWFIDLVFKVMELAWWHRFQVLTKRAERMAEYTQRRYKDNQPPKNIWCGTSVEDQKNYDERIVHLRNTKAAALWLSVEPMLRPIDFGDLKGIGWMVVGGESSSDRKMDKAWATEARDQCENFKIPFYFKQWGSFNEQGEKMTGKPKKDGLVPATLDGVVHNAYLDLANTNNPEQEVK